MGVTRADGLVVITSTHEARIVNIILIRRADSRCDDIVQLCQMCSGCFFTYRGGHHIRDRATAKQRTLWLPARRVSLVAFNAMRLSE